MRDRSRKYLYDVREMIELVTRATASKTYEEYRNNTPLRHPVERELLIIGEALAQLSQRDESSAARVTDLRGIVGLRDVLTHEYVNVDHRRIWRVIQVDLPILDAEVKAMLVEE